MLDINHNLINVRSADLSSSSRAIDPESLLRVKNTNQALEVSTSFPASIVTVESASAAELPDLNTYSKPTINIVYANQSAADDPVTGAMESRLNLLESAKYLGSSMNHLSSLIRGDSQEFSQTVAKSYVSSEKLATKPELSSQDVTTGFEMELTTKDGDTVKFSVAYGVNMGESGIFPTMSLEFSVDGELSEEEQADIDALVQSLSTELDRFVKSGSVDLSRLKLPELDSIADLNLEVKDRSNRARAELWDGNSLKLKFSSDGGENRLSVDLNGDKVEVSGVASHFSSVVDEAKLEQSKQHFMQLISDNVQDAHGSREQAKLIKDAFAMLQGLAGDDNEDKTNSGDQKPIAVNLGDVKTEAAIAASAPANVRDQSLLTGLDDFELSFVSHKEQPNIDQKPMEYQGFSLNLSQQTNVRGNIGFESIEQKQDLSLKAHFYEPVSYLEDTDFETQTYRYSVLDKSASTTSIQNYDSFELQSAVVFASSNENLNTIEFQLGKLVSDVSVPKHSESVQDFTTVLAAFEGEQQLNLLDQILLKDSE